MAVLLIFFVPVFDPVCFGAKDEFKTVFDSDFAAFVIFALPAMFKRTEDLLIKFYSAFGILLVCCRGIRGIDVGATGVLMVILNSITSAFRNILQPQSLCAGRFYLSL